MITHEHPGYIKRYNKLGKARYNGCYYYSKEIVENIIPRVKTNRDWNTVGRDLDGMHDGMIVFLHDNSTPWNYRWLQNYKDLVLVCSSKYTAKSVKYSGHVVYLPMNIDTKYVKKFRTKQTKDLCFAGNVWVRKNSRNRIPSGIPSLSSLPREEMLQELAQFHRVYCIDRCAQEAKVLGLEVLPLDTRYGCDSTEVLDNRDAAKILQRELDKIDGGSRAKDKNHAHWWQIHRAGTK